MAKKISPSMLRSQYQQWIEEHKYLPDYMKDELKQLVSTHFGIIAQMIGTVELTYRRTMDTMKEAEPKETGDDGQAD